MELNIFMFDKLFNVRSDIINLKWLVTYVTYQYPRVPCYCGKVKVQCLKWGSKWKRQFCKLRASCKCALGEMCKLPNVHKSWVRRLSRVGWLGELVPPLPPPCTFSTRRCHHQHHQQWTINNLSHILQPVLVCAICLHRDISLTAF